MRTPFTLSPEAQEAANERRRREAAETRAQLAQMTEAIQQDQRQEEQARLTEAYVLGHHYSPSGDVEALADAVLCYQIGGSSDGDFFLESHNALNGKTKRRRLQKVTA